MKRIITVTILTILFSCGSNESELLKKEALEKFNNEKYLESLNDYSELLLKDSLNADVVVKVAECKYKLKDYFGVIQDCSYGLALRNDADFYSLRGKSYEALNISELALRDYDKALEINPNLSVILNNRSVIMMNNTEGLERALIDVNLAIELDSNQGIFYNNRGLIYVELEEYEKAIKDYNVSIELDSTYLPLFFNRGVCLVYLEQYQEAIADFKLVENLEINNDGRVSHSKAIAHFKLEEFEEACIDWKRSAELGDKESLEYYNSFCVKKMGSPSLGVE